jgi:hypothetical protein
LDVNASLINLVMVTVSLTSAFAEVKVIIQNF